MQRSRLRYFFLGRWIKMFNPPCQQEFLRKARMLVSFTPYNGKEKAVRKLVEKYFPAKEVLRVMKCLRNNQHFFMDETQSGKRFQKELFAIVSACDVSVSDLPYEPVIFLSDRSWYAGLDEVFSCPTHGITDKVKWHPEKDDILVCTSCGSPVVRLSDMTTKEVKLVEKQRRRNEESVDSEFEEVVDVRVEGGISF